MAAPIVSVKHIVQRTSNATGSGSITSVPIVVAVDAPASGTTSEVLQGSIVKAIYIELWGLGGGAVTTETQFTISLEKRSAVAAHSMDFTESQNLSAYLNKKNIFYITQGIVGNVEASASMPFIRQWIAIPKGKQRMGLGDEVVLNISAVGQIFQNCGVFIYKEYR